MPKLTYGLNPAGEMVSIEQVESGKTDLNCPGCRVRLTANKGPRQGWYFSHANHSKDVFCPLRSKGGSGFPYTRKNFHLPVNTRQMAELKHIHQHKHPTDETVAQPLIKKGLVTHNPNPYSLTQQGKITLGLLPVAEFADFHLSLITGIELTKAQLSKGPDDLPIEDGKKRLLSSNLYFVQIENNEIPDLYKFGMTSRNHTERLIEIKNELSKHLSGQFTVRLIAWKEGRGHCEAYMLHRFKEYEHKIGSMTEYRTLSGSLAKSIKEELAQLDDRTPCQPVARKLSAQEIPNRTETELPSSSFEEKGQGFVEIPVQVLTQKPQTSRHEEPDLAADLPEVPPQLDRHNDQSAETKTTPMKYKNEEVRLSKAPTKPNYEKENSLLGKVTSLLKSWWSKTSAQ